MSQTARPVDRQDMYMLIMDEETSACGTRAQKSRPLRVAYGTRFAVRIVPSCAPAANGTSGEQVR